MCVIDHVGNRFEIGLMEAHREGTAAWSFGSSLTGLTLICFAKERSARCKQRSESGRVMLGSVKSLSHFHSRVGGSRSDFRYAQASVVLPNGQQREQIV